MGSISVLIIDQHLDFIYQQSFSPGWKKYNLENRDRKTRKYDFTVTGTILINREA
jgi:hypothetical protein